MKAKLLSLSLGLFLLSFVLVNNTNSQNVAVTDDAAYTADSSAMLDVKSTNKGMLIPRMDSTQRVTISNPATGLLVFDTEANGFFYYNGTDWISLSTQIVSPASAGANYALFSVVNTSGDTVFAVYPEAVAIQVGSGTSKANRGGFAVGGLSNVGKLTAPKYLMVSPDSVRIYVDTADTKANKGGFAVGGLSNTGKSINVNYLTVSDDSVRIYLDTTSTAKGYKGGFAVGGLSNAGKGIPENFFNISSGSTVDTINPSEARILWYPKKEAFLTGRVLIEKPDSVGKNSMATGYQSKSIGNYSQALGYEAIARGHLSTAIGYKTVANDSNSYAFGSNAAAYGKSSFALGNNALAVGTGSFALGSSGADSAGALTPDTTKAIGDGCFALGFGAKALGWNSFAIGRWTEATDGSMAFGYETTSSGGNGSLAMGFWTKASGEYSTAMGQQTRASGSASTAMGYITKASGAISTSMGYNTRASGVGSTTMGYNTSSSGIHSTAIGSSTTARAYCSLVIGRYNDTLTTSSLTSWVGTDPLLIIGNGSHDGARSSAMTVLKNGNVGIGTMNQFGSGLGIFSLKNAATEPTTSLTNAAALYAYGGELFAYDSVGNATQISPHDPETGEWIFYSKNTKTGRVVRINMEQLVKKVEELTGENFMEEWIE